jgi:hypothetical protein
MHLDQGRRMMQNESTGKMEVESSDSSAIMILSILLTVCYLAATFLARAAY